MDQYRTCTVHAHAYSTVRIGYKVTGLSDKVDMVKKTNKHNKQKQNVKKP